jgi:hypothetical protein
VVLVGGRPELYVTPASRHLISFTSPDGPDDNVLRAAVAALHRFPSGARRGRLRIEKIDGAPAHDSPLYDPLLRCGFERSYRGLALGDPLSVE